MPIGINAIVFTLLFLVILGGMGYLFVLICKALRKFIGSSSVRKEKECLKNLWVKRSRNTEFVVK